MAIDYGNKNLYRDLSIITQAYEEGLKRNDDELAIKVLALKPLSGINKMLNTTESVLDDSMQSNEYATSQESQTTLNTSKFLNLSFGTQLQELTGESNLLDYLDDCFDCDLRVEFQWQLAPLNLLDSLFDLLDEINAALTLLEKGIDPNAFLGDLCTFLNNLRWLCIPDLIALLVSLQASLQIKKVELLKISFDWTTLLAPLLQAVLQILDMILDGAFDIINAPIECLYGALRTLADLEKAALEAKYSFEGLTDTTIDINVQNNYRSVGLDPEDLDVNIGNSKTKNTDYGQFDFYTGTDFSVVRIPDALADPSFANAHWTSKMLVPIADLRADLHGLKQQLDDALAALKGLTSNGLLLQIQNVSSILYIIQMIKLCILLIELVREYKGMDIDFCDDLSSEPDKYNNKVNAIFPGVSLSIDADRTVVVKSGDKIINSSQPCLKSNPILDRWIADLDIARGTHG